MKKQLSKKQLKKQKTKQAILFEMVLLYPAFSYLHEQYKFAEKDDGPKTKEDYEFLKLAKQLTSKIALVISPYKSYQKEALQIINDILIEMDTEDINIVLFGTYLLNQHHYIENKKIHISLFDNIIDIEEYMLNKINSNKSADRIYETVNTFFKHAQKRVFAL